MSSLRSMFESSISWVHDYSTAVFSKGQLAPFSRAERIARAATRASPAWGPALSELRTVALLCEAPSTAAEVAGVLSRRLDPPAAAWRRAAKALAVVEHLATCGGPGAARVAFATANLLDDLAARFQAYDDETGRDVGEGVRVAAARLAALMRDPAALEEARAVARMVRERARGSGGGGFGGGGAGGFPRLPAPAPVLALPAAPELRSSEPEAALPRPSAAAAAAAAPSSADPAHVSAAPTPAPSPPPPPPQPQAPLPDLLSFDDDEDTTTATAAATAASSSASPATVLPLQGAEAAAAETTAAAPSSSSSAPSSTDLPSAFAAPAAIITAPPVFTWHPVKKPPAGSLGSQKPATPAEALEQMLRSSVETFDGQAAAAGNGAMLLGAAGTGGDGRRTPPRPPPMSSAVPI